MVYLFALIDLYSRYIVGWRLAITMEATHALEAFRDGLKWGIPELCNADQGAQFTSEGWIICLSSYGVLISHVGVGRCIDNIRIERFWWTLKYEDVHLSNYETVPAARVGIGNFIKYYNEERPHQALGYKTPSEMYFGPKLLRDASFLGQAVSGSIGDSVIQREHRVLSSPQGQQPSPCLLTIESQGRAGAIGLWTT